MIHQLKCESEYFEAVTSGAKSFEIRFNDRRFSIGDFLALNEITPHPCNEMGERLETGRCCLVEVTYILDDAKYLPDGFVAMAIRPCAIRSRQHEFTGEPTRYYTVPIYDSTSGVTV